MRPSAIRCRVCPWAWIAATLLSLLQGCALSHERREAGAAGDAGGSASDAASGAPDAEVGRDAGGCGPDCPYVAVAAGAFHTCALRSTGEVACWGAGADGQLGDGATSHGTCAMMVDCAVRPVVVTGLHDAVQLALGDAYTCARRASGEVVCWGRNWSGQLGNGTRTNSATPVAVQGVGDAIQIAAGLRAACAVRASGQVVCWGQAELGALGDGLPAHSMCDETECSLVPVTVAGLTDAVEVAVGFDHACARRASGAVVCWGQGEHGERGDGTTANALSPAPVPGITDAIGLAAAVYTTCAVRSSGGVVCWGDNFAGHLGDGSFVHGAVCPGRDCSPTPVAVAAVGGAASVVLGDWFGCALETTGTVRCWGSDASGELGDGPTSHPDPACDVSTFCSATAVDVIGLTGVVSISGSWAHACALTGSGSVMCWGDGSLGQLGTGDASPSDAPVRSGA